MRGVMTRDEFVAKYGWEIVPGVREMVVFYLDDGTRVEDREATVAENILWNELIFPAEMKRNHERLQALAASGFRQCEERAEFKWTSEAKELLKQAKCRCLLPIGHDGEHEFVL